MYDGIDRDVTVTNLDSGSLYFFLRFQHAYCGEGEKSMATNTTVSSATASTPPSNLQLSVYNDCSNEGIGRVSCNPSAGPFSVTWGEPVRSGGGTVAYYNIYPLLPSAKPSSGQVYTLQRIIRCRLKCTIRCIYTFNRPDHRGVYKTYCDMTSDGGGGHYFTSH